MALLSTLKPESKHTVLVYGDSGNGKTVFATSFPSPMKVFDFDGKIMSAVSYWGQKDATRLTQIDVEDLQSMNAHPEQYSKFYTLLSQLESQAKAGNFPWKTVVLDSLTTWCDALMREIVRQNPGIKGAAPGLPGLQHYGLFGSKFREQLSRLLALPCNIVVTAHIDITKDENTGEILRRPLVIGKNASYLPIIFGEVYRAFAETKDGKTEYWAQTQASGSWIARSQIPGLAPKIPLTYQSLVNNKN